MIYSDPKEREHAHAELIDALVDALYMDPERARERIVVALIIAKRLEVSEPIAC